MKRILPLLAVLAAPALAQDAAPAAEAPAAPAVEVPAAPAVEAPAAPVPGRVLLPKPSRLDSLPPDEREHIRRMAEFRAARDAAERKILELGDRALARKKAIVEENEDAKELFERIAELRTELTAATNALETIFRDDEELARIAGELEPLRKTVESNQVSLNHEVATAMQIRMAAQRAAHEKANPQPGQPAETPEAFGMTPEAFSNFVSRPLPRHPDDPVDPARRRPNPDIKPPLAPRQPVPAPAPAPAAE